MTVPLDTVNDIRSMDAAGRSRSEIARVPHVSRNTRAKYAGRIIATLENGERVVISRQYAPDVKSKLGLK